jgi:phage-related protein
MYIIPMKDVVFEKTSLDDLRAFPDEARRDAGRQLDRVQRGKEPFDSKPMASIGSGVREIRITDAAGQFRVIYVAKFEDAIYVLHCFQKKTQKTSLPDVRLAKDRYNDLVRRLRK